MSRKISLLVFAALLTVVSAGMANAEDSSLWTVRTTPDALIIIDRSGSMSELPQGSNPTFYASDCGGSGPFYTSNSGGNCLTPTQLYATSCSSMTNPYYVTQPGSKPTGNLWVTGTDCNIDGPYSLAAGSDRLNIGNGTDYGTNVYAVLPTSCNGTFNGPYYKTSNSSHKNSCPVSTALPANIVYSETSDCSTGPFYKTYGSGHTNACTKYTRCTTPFSSVPTAWSESSCTVGPFYKTSGSGHTTSCVTTSSCAVGTTTFYSESDCTSGPFYKTSGGTYTTQCIRCNTCTPSSSNIPWSETASCDGPFYNSSGTGHTTNCSKIEIAKRALFGLLDDTNSDDTSKTQINATDVTSLSLRLGLMSYYNCSTGSITSNSYVYTNSSSCIKLNWGITQADNTTTTPYANIYCNNSNCLDTVTACTTCSTSTSSCTAGASCIVGFDNANYTPLAYSLREGKKYLDAHKLLDPSASCRNKSIIVVTDGADTIACSAGGSTGAAQRKAPIYFAKEASKVPNNYKVYVVGFGVGMPNDLKNTLNWMAYYGNTKNSHDTQSGSTTAVQADSGPCSNDGTDPATHNLSGYAFMATSPDELASALRTAVESISSANYSFSSQASVAAARTSEENYIYEASFEPKNNAGSLKEPFWTGHLKKYQLNTSTGGLLSSPVDAGAALAAKSADARHMYTYKGSGLVSFDTVNITKNDLAVATDTRRNEVVGFYRGEAAYNLENWKLGDLFHTNPVVVKTPTLFFYDPRESGATSFNAYRIANPRSSASSTNPQIILAGGNDGQMHAFWTGNMEEQWSFIPPNLLQKLQTIAHNVHPADQSTLPSHEYFIDGPIQIADAWLPSSEGTGETKTSGQWKTIAVFGLGPGTAAVSGLNYLWSHQSSCYSTSASDFSSAYSTTYPYYCGFHALDVTNTSATSPTYLWHLSTTLSPTPMPYLGEAWSKMQIGRVKNGSYEKWVGFIGGGYNSSICGSSDTCNAADGKGAGKGLFVVDLTNGNIIWAFTHGASATLKTHPDMDYAAPAAPLIVDLDGDGFIDTVYMGDMGGNMWRARLCSASDGSTCGTANWAGSKLYAASDAERGADYAHKQIFTKATATKDVLGNVWVYFGTGQNNDPTYKPTTALPDTSYTKNRLYGIKEDYNWPGNTNFTATYTTNHLTDITSTSTSYDGLTATTHGWFINLSTNNVGSGTNTISSPLGEKMISDPTVFGGVVYFASYVPAQSTSSACGLAGNAFLYGLNYLTGAGVLTADGGGGATAGSNRTSWIGQGIGSSILVSYRPGNTAVDIYATASGGAGTAALTQQLGEAPPTSSMTNVIFWKDGRVN